MAADKLPPAADPGESSAPWAARLDTGWWRRTRRVPVALQAEAAECGLACLAMVAGAHGLDIDLITLRQRLSLSLKGMTAADVLQAAACLGLEGRGLRAEPEHLGSLQMPCILHWDMNHFVVLVSCKGVVVTLHDPARGEVRMPLAELSKHFTGVVLELAPTPSFQPRRQRVSLSLRSLMGPVYGLRRGLSQIVLLALALELFVLLTPFLLQWVVDDVLVSGDRELLLTLGLGFILLVLFQAATAALRSWAVLALSASLNLQWLVNVFSHLLRLPLGWFEKRQLGDVWSRYLSVQAIQRSLTTSFVEALLDGVMVVLTLVMMALYSSKLLAVALAATLLYALLRWAFYHPLRRSTEDALVLEARQSGHFVETLRGMQAIKLFNAQAQRRSVFSAMVVDTMNAQLATRKIDVGFAVLQRLLFGLERVVVIWLGALLVLEQQLSVGMLLAFFAYKEQFSQRVAELIDKSVELAMLRLQGERLADIVLAPPEAAGSASFSPSAQRGAPATTQRAASCGSSIELRDVRFRYADGEPDVLSGINLRFGAGESVALIGPSGCGKSTLVKLILGLHVPTAGLVLIDGVPLARMGAFAWREAVGAVMQDDQLFTGSIAENICFFDLQADPHRVEHCARMAAVHADIEAMPMGYQTLVGDMGSALSGGQKQRVLLARALYRRPQVLVLDEATSALDVAGERLVNDAVATLSLTRIVVAHRPETIASAQRVVMLHEGRVVSSGDGGVQAGC